MKACQNCGGTEWVRCEDGTACANCGVLPYIDYERIATPAEHSQLHATGWRETNLKTLWIAPPSYGGGFHSVDEALAEVVRVEGINA